MEKAIVVNATALDRSGALTILYQFVANIPADGKTRWVIFVSDIINLSSENPLVEIIPVSGVKAMHKRFFWDAFGLKRRLKKMAIEPLACISLQNTGFRAGKKDTPRFLYYHQPVAFFPNKWSPLKSDQRTFWFYKNIYPLFVKMFLTKDTEVFVQLDFIKEGFERLFNHPAERIGIYSPTVKEPENSNERPDIDPADLNLFYPAAPYFYKNYRTITSAIDMLPASLRPRLNITFGSDIYKDWDRARCHGKIPYSQVCALFRHCDALLFPSYIETFGMPLLEAAMTGMPILAADLPYARQVLAGYEGAQFVDHTDPKAWADAISKLEKGKRYRPIDISGRAGWKELFDHINKITFNN